MSIALCHEEHFPLTCGTFVLSRTLCGTAAVRILAGGNAAALAGTFHGGESITIRTVASDEVAVPVKVEVYVPRRVGAALLERAR